MTRNVRVRGPSDGGGVRLPDATEEKRYDEVEDAGWNAVGGGTGNGCGARAGCGEKGATETGSESIGSGAGVLERHRQEVDRDCGRFAGRQVRLQAESGFANVSRGANSRIRVDVLLHGHREWKEATPAGRPKASRPEYQQQGGFGGLREKVRCRW